MTERDILEKTYDAQALVFRRIEKKDEQTKQTKQVDQIVISALPCGLSRDKSGSHTVSDDVGWTSSSYTLFCAPDIDICAGDHLIVCTNSERFLELWAGKPFRYDSHMEIPLTSKERA